MSCEDYNCFGYFSSLILKIISSFNFTCTLEQNCFRSLKTFLSFLFYLLSEKEKRENT